MSKPTTFKRRLVAIGFNAVFSTVLAVSFMIFRSLAAEGSPFLLLNCTRLTYAIRLARRHVEDRPIGSDQ
jgi:hypothetical protein